MIMGEWWIYYPVTLGLCDSLLWKPWPMNNIHDKYDGLAMISTSFNGDFPLRYVK